MTSSTLFINEQFYFLDTAHNIISNRRFEISNCTKELFGAPQRRKAVFILQMHDELIYEVYEPDLNNVAEIIKYNMECAMKLLVCLPVKLKAGPAWGSLVDLQL